MSGKDDGCAERVLAKALVRAGVVRQPGETVRLRPAQIERLAMRTTLPLIFRTATPFSFTKNELVKKPVKDDGFRFAVEGVTKFPNRGSV